MLKLVKVMKIYNQVAKNKSKKYQNVVMKDQFQRDPTFPILYE